jgi:hypothetical protein
MFSPAFKPTFLGPSGSIYGESALAEKPEPPAMLVTVLEARKDHPNRGSKKAGGQRSSEAPMGSGAETSITLDLQTRSDRRRKGYLLTLHRLGTSIVIRGQPQSAPS